MTILYIFIAVIVGWFIGFLDSNLRTSKKIRAAEENAERIVEEAERRVLQVEKKYTDAFPAQDDPGLLRLKKDNGRYLLELDGAPVTGELSQDMRKRLIELITVFRLWLDPAKPASPSKASRPSVPDPIREAVYGEVAEDPIQPAPVMDSISRPVLAPQPAAVKKPEVEKNIKSLSIVQQIDTVLQEKLMTSPFARRGIRLQESIQGGVEVYVGIQKFETVDDVPDAEIKAVIRSAIAEWEKKYTPGM
jgi:hypothetical protein